MESADLFAKLFDAADINLNLESGLEYHNKKFLRLLYRIILTPSSQPNKASYYYVAIIISALFPGILGFEY